MKSLDTIQYDVEDVSQEGLNTIAEHARALRLAQEAVAKAEAELALLKNRVTVIETIELPEAMRTLGLEKFTLSSGEMVSVREEVNAGITDANREAAFAWLRATGNDSLIKRTVTVAFGRGDDAIATKMLEAISELAPDLELQDKAAVNPQTLKAFVRERIELEHPDPETGEMLVPEEKLIPRATFGVFIINRAVVKRPKKGD